MSQFFKGYLAEMMYLPGRVERPNVLQCALQCKERLDFTALNQLRDGEVRKRGLWQRMGVITSCFF